MYWLVWSVLIVLTLGAYLDSRQDKPQLPPWVLPLLVVLLTLGVGLVVAAKLFRQTKPPTTPLVLTKGDSEALEGQQEQAEALVEEVEDLVVRAKTTDQEIDNVADDDVPDDLTEQLRKRGVLGS